MSRISSWAILNICYTSWNFGIAWAHGHWGICHFKVPKRPAIDGSMLGGQSKDNTNPNLFSDSSYMHRRYSLASSKPQTNLIFMKKKMQVKSNTNRGCYWGELLESRFWLCFLYFKHLLISLRALHLFPIKSQVEIIKFVEEESDPLAIGSAFAAVNARAIDVPAPWQYELSQYCAHQEEELQAMEKIWRLHLIIFHPRPLRNFK